MARSIVALLTDFGTRDSYVAQLKGVILERSPDARFVDITHEVAFGDVIEAAWHLANAWPALPEGTVFLCVVDPEVGSSRRAIALEARGRLGVGPDNGLFGFVSDGARAVELTRRELWREPVSPTFWGRDVFAPVAAALASGTPLEEVGTPISGPRPLGFPRAERRDDGSVVGSVVHVDRFGNVVTNIRADAIPPGPIRVAVRDARILRRVASYHEAPPGELVALVNSADHLEIALREGNAAQRLGITRGERVEVRLP